MTEDTLDQMGHDVESKAHRAECAECALVWADLERISAEASALPLLSSSRDLWAGIDERLGAPFVSPSVGPIAAIARSRENAPRRFYSSRTVRLATAASLLIAATATVTWTLATGRTLDLPSPAASVATGLVVEEQPTVSPELVQQASLHATVAMMDREIAELDAMLDERRASLDPRIVTVLEENMQLIDTAIAESQQALENAPASRFLATQYTRAYHSKLTLLRGAATLPAGT